MEVDRAPHQDRTEEANDLVPLFLGALKLLDDFAEAASASAAVDDGRGKHGDDAMLAAALGLLSLRRTLKRWAWQAAHDHALSSTMPPIAVSRETVTLR
jgi:hypothetical protein